MMARLINRWRKWFPHPAVADMRRRRELSRKCVHRHDISRDPILRERGVV